MAYHLDIVILKYISWISARYGNSIKAS